VPKISHALNENNTPSAKAVIISLLFTFDHPPLKKIIKIEKKLDIIIHCLYGMGANTSLAKAIKKGCHKAAPVMLNR
jgi:hypothetical protein